MGIVMFTYHKLIVAGGRDFNDYELLSKKLESFRVAAWEVADELEVVSGGARGADSLGERWAKENHVPCIVFPAEWNVYGKRAGPIRNEQMGEYADSLLAFWDGKSRGTGHMINYSKNNGLNVFIVRY
jgi:hypothetical protein